MSARDLRFFPRRFPLVIFVLRVLEVTSFPYAYANVGGESQAMLSVSTRRLKEFVQYRRHAQHLAP
jgi:hypothetical protein